MFESEVLCMHVCVWETGEHWVLHAFVSLTSGFDMSSTRILDLEIDLAVFLG